MKAYFAHSLEGRPLGEWQSLEHHLRAVAEMARQFAETIRARQWGYYAGLWHDLGKYAREFQDMLNGTKTHVDHSSSGAQQAFRAFGEQKGRIIAYAIAGHHAGLLDGKSVDESCLEARLSKQVKDWSACPDAILVSGELEPPPFLPQGPIDVKRFAFGISFFIRMLFSCLVDADFLDTERFIDSERALHRRGYRSLKEIQKALKIGLAAIQANARDSTVNRHRTEVLEQCLRASSYGPGIFSLTVPTGGGKTLSSLAFAVSHALKHDLRRVIYVIPYTSIIEQNASVFRSILGDDAVLEHHSNFEAETDDERSQLAAENWDCPLVVTTNVQFFESLFASRSSRARKLHNIAESVVILDEAQMLPVPLLRPAMEALRELAHAYRTTILFCTATQPALATSDTFPNGIDGVREIITDPKVLHQKLQRTSVELIGKKTDEELAVLMNGYGQALCIVNTRSHARNLFESVKTRASVYHLSALMCPKHRSEAIEKIKARLRKGAECRVVSTQLIEAGVDIDFPVVFREMTGIDSIAQAAGRCNREGILEMGTAFVFEPEKPLPAGFFRQSADITREVIRQFGADLLAPDSVRRYFEHLYWSKSDALDEKGILADLAEDVKRLNFPFRSIAEKFRLIEEVQSPVIIPYDQEALRIIDQLRAGRSGGALARKAQRYTVQVHQQMFARLLSAGALEIVQGIYPVLINEALYRREDIGLFFEDVGYLDAESLII